ncbi:uncharacterized protein LOC144168318 [Haemaphysalis longicornis]
MSLRWSGYAVDNPGCKLPSYDAYHRSVRRSAKEQPYSYETYCNSKKPTVIRQHRSVFLLDDDELLRSYNVTGNETSCFYQEVLRNSLSLVPDSSQVLGPKLSVLVVGVDSTSRLNSLRRMQKSRSYLIEERNAFDFMAYNKLGINSFPNLIPLLLGLSGADFERLFKNVHYDSIPFVWKVYKSLNYTTLYLEEMPYYSIFSGSNRYGFKAAPTDYYPQPMLLSMDRGDYKAVYCMGSRLKTKEILKYTSDILIMNRDHPMFAYVFLSYITHDSSSDLAYLDGLLEEFFKGLGASGVLDQTAVLFFSDHGMRFGNATRTTIGRHEDKTPFCIWVFPRGFLAEHPEAAVWLEVNQRRLVTTYDFHATLLSIASLPALQIKPTNKGISLMSAVPPERTCEDAFIPYAFCACDGAEKKLNDTSIGLSFAVFAITYINAQAQANFPGKCVTSRRSLAARTL